MKQAGDFLSKFGCGGRVLGIEGKSDTAENRKR
jgi:hypothetical protein